MSFGLQVLNNSGDVVIDSDFQNHVIAETGTVASPTLTASDTSGLNTVTFSGSYDIGRQPMIFGRCTGDWIGFYAWTLSGSNVTGFTFWAKGGGSSFDWKLLVTPNAASADAEGMRIFDGSSNVVYDSGLPYLNLVDALAISLDNAGGTTAFTSGSVSHASATTAFYCLSSGRSSAVRTLIVPRELVAAYKAVDATHVDHDWAGAPNSGGVNVHPCPLTPTLLVMDATAPTASTAFGMNVYDGSGNVRLTMTSKLTRFLYHNLVLAGASSNANVSGLDPAKCVGFAVPRAPASGLVPHNVTLTSGNVAWAPPAGGTNVDSDVYVIQYK